MKTKKQKTVIIYHDYMHCIGGIESWIYYLSEHLYKYYDITFLFNCGSIEQIKRINKYIKVEHIDRNKIYDCDVFLIASNWTEFPQNIKYKKCIAVVHSDYKYYKEHLKNSVALQKKANEYVCVSQKASDSLKELFDNPGIVIENILGNKVKTNKILHLVSFTRLSEEKGYSRMCKFVKILKDNNIKFDWKIFSDIEGKNLNKLDCPEVIFMKPTLDIYDYIVDADYLVQLSDTEAFCYSVHEALQYGTPVIVTDIDVFKDIVVNGYNGYKFNLDMSNIDNDMLDNIINHIPNDFVYNERFEELKEKWFEVLGEPVEINEINEDNEDDGECKNNINSPTVAVEIIDYYYDKKLKKNMFPGDVIKVDNLRAYELSTINNDAHMKLGKII